MIHKSFIINESNLPLLDWWLAKQSLVQVSGYRMEGMSVPGDGFIAKSEA